MGYCNKWNAKYGVYAYFVFRVFVGLLFLQHGGQKLFGWFGGKGVELVSLMGLAGIVELFGGLFIAFGFLTRISATIAAVQMAFAWFMAHVSKGWIPILNGGELALLFLAAFLALTVYGAGKWSLERQLFGKEHF
jgi:putative oxidoreductase